MRVQVISNQRRPSREDALAISKRELTSDEVRNVLMSKLNEGDKVWEVTAF